MKSLESYIESKLYEERVKDVLGGIIVNESYEDIDLNEMLMSHDADKMIEAFKSILPSSVEYEKGSNEKLCIVSLKFENVIDKYNFLNDTKNKLMDTAENRVLNFFNYFVTNNDREYVNLEPEFPEKIDSEVLANCHDYFLHITKNENVNSILRVGLRCRNEYTENELRKNPKLKPYRKFPKRTYFVAKDVYGKALDKKIIDVMHDMKIKDSDFGNYTVLEVFLGGHRGMTLYKDLAMEREDCCFTYETIRPERIKILKKL